MYKEKYLKYKTKYLELKKMNGGNINVHYHISDEVLLPNDNVNALITGKMLSIPMSAYYDVTNLDKRLLITTGVRDCVVLILFNPKFGRYLAHYLKYNDFFEELSNACESIGVQDKDCEVIDKLPSCDNNSKKIVSTLPEWLLDNNTSIHIFNLLDVYTLVSRYRQLIKKITEKSNVHIHMYINNSVNLVIKNFTEMKEDWVKEYIDNAKQTKEKDKRLLQTLPNIEKFLPIWNTNYPKLSALGAGITSEGRVFTFEYNGTFTNKSLERFLKLDNTAPHANKQCISKYAAEYTK
jgi:hypothetical protein